MKAKTIPVVLTVIALLSLAVVATIFFARPVLSATQDSLISTFATLLGIFIAAGMIVWQQRDAARTSVMLDRYDRARRALIEAQGAVGKFASFARFLPTDLAMYVDALKNDGTAVPPASRFLEFQWLRNKAWFATADAIDGVGGCEVVVPDAALLRLALVCAHSDAERATEKLAPLLMNSLPMDTPQGAVINAGPVPPQVREQIKALTEVLLASLDDLQSYCTDSDDDLVNRLVGNLFNNPARRRKPADSRMLVLSTSEPHKTRVKQWLQSHHLVQKTDALGKWAAARKDHDS